MSAKDAIGLVEARMGQRSGSDFLRQSQPADVDAVHVARETLALEIKFL